MTRLSLGYILDLKIRDIAKLLALMGVIVMTGRTFSPFPGFPPVQEAWNVVCILYLVYLYPWLKPKGRARTSPFEWYVLVLIAIIPVWAGICAHNEFGQPVIYGILAVRAMVLLAGVLFLVRSLRDGLFTLRDVERALLILAWGLAALYIVMRLFLNPDAFTSYLGFAIAGENGSPAHFTLQPDFVIFGAFYYALLGFRTGRAANYALAIVLLASAIDQYGGREMIAALLLAFLVLVFRWAGWRRLLIVVPQLMMGFALLAGLLYVTMPAVTAERAGKFRDAFAVVLTGAPGEDTSANMHLMEALYTLPAIAKHPMLGNGRVSAQWEGGGDRVRDTHFYPEDVGLLGVLYQHGVLGLILFGCQYWFALRAARKLPAGFSTPFLDAIKGFLLYSLFVSLGYGMFVFSAPSTLMFIALLMAIASEIGTEEIASHARAAEAPSQEWALGLSLNRDRCDG